MGFLVVGWGSLKKSLAYGGGFQAAYMLLDTTGRFVAQVGFVVDKNAGKAAGQLV